MTLDTERLYDYWPSVFSFIRLRMERHDLAAIEDLTGETFLRAISKAGTYHERGEGPGNWLLTIARNLVIDWRRRQRHATLVEVGVADIERGTLDAGSDAQDAVIDVQGALRSLPDEDRHILWAYANDGLTFREAGRSLGFDKSKSHRRRAAGAEALRGLLESTYA